MSWRSCSSTASLDSAMHTRVLPMKSNFVASSSPGTLLSRAPVLGQPSWSM